jgi:hypothetical protein
MSNPQANAGSYVKAGMTAEHKDPHPQPAQDVSGGGQIRADQFFRFCFSVWVFIL